MIAGVADTHAALWYLFGDTRLSALAKAFIDQAAASGHKIAVSSISLAETIYLVEKNRLPFAAYERLRQALSIVDYVIAEAPLTSGIVDAMRSIPRADVPDMPDRIVAATAAYYGAPVISRDGRIRASGLQTVW
ncbi:MAG: type II toxin-antitoxin system VapC family toxin [Bryobacteraceae bacterium]|nr:type II toxin-antitoxin system VapC family toxin [Bryobacteraceae bacterium]